MKLRTFGYFLKQASLSLLRNKLISIASIATLSVCIFIVGLMSLIALNANFIMNNLESNVEIVAFIKSDVPRQEVIELGDQIKAIKGVTEIGLVTKEEGLQELGKKFDNNDLTATLGGRNPLPDYYKIKAENETYVKTIADTLEQVINVDKVNYGQGVVEKLFAFAKWVRVMGGSIAVLLSLGALFLISTTIRLTVFSRRKEIEVMKYVGATNGFIRWPFFIEGMIIGLVGSVIAIASLSFIYDFLLTNLKYNVSFIHLISDYVLLSKIFIGLLGVGIFLGALGSVVSIRRFLQV